MRYAMLPLAILITMAIGCRSDDDDRPIHVTVQNPPQPAPPPTVIVRESDAQPLPPNTTVTPAAPPVDGQSYRVDDVDVIYSEPMRGYTVSGYNDYYYVNGHFYRYDRGRWEWAPHMRTGWVRVEERDVPQTLVIRYRR